MAARSEQRPLRVPKTVLLCLLMSSVRLQILSIYHQFIRNSLQNTSMIAKAFWISATHTNTNYRRRLLRSYKAFVYCWSRTSRTRPRLLTLPAQGGVSKHPPTLPHQRKICMKLFVQFKVCYTQVSGPIHTTCSNTLSSMRTRHISHTAVCTQSHKRLSNICKFTCSCTTNHLALFPSQLLDSQCFSLHMYSIYVKHSYSLYFSFLFFIFYL